MTIYIDYYLLFNFFMCYIQLYLTKILYNNKASKLTVFIGSLFGTVYSLTALLNEFNNSIFKYLVCAGIIGFVFKYNSFIEFLKTYLVFIITVFMFGGCIYSISNSVSLINIFIATLASYIILWLFSKFYKKYTIQKSFVVPVKIFFNGEMIQLNGLIDTGNSLIDPYTNLPVMVIHRGNFNFENIKTRLVPFDTVGQANGIIEVFTPDKVLVNNKESRCAVGINNEILTFDKGFNAILNPQII